MKIILSINGTERVCYRNLGDAVAAMKALKKKKLNKPIELHTIEGDRICTKCGGDGIYIRKSASGVYPAKCFGCCGKGVQSKADIGRCNAWFYHQVRQSAALPA